MLSPLAALLVAGPLAVQGPIVPRNSCQIELILIDRDGELVADAGWDVVAEMAGEFDRMPGVYEPRSASRVMRLAHDGLPQLQEVWIRAEHTLAPACFARVFVTPGETRTVMLTVEPPRPESRLDIELLGRSELIRIFAPECCVLRPVAGGARLPPPVVLGRLPQRWLRFEGLVPGALYRLEFAAPWQALGARQVAAGGPVSVDLGEGASLLLVVPAGWVRAVAGTALLAQSSHGTDLEFGELLPVAGKDAFLVSGLSGGDWRCVLNVPGREQLAFRVDDLELGEQRRIVLAEECEPPVRVRGRLVDALGAAHPDRGRLMIVFQPPFSPPLSRTMPPRPPIVARLNDAAEFELELPYSGEWTARVLLPPRELARQVLDVAPDAPPFVWTVRDVAQLAVRLVLPEGARLGDRRLFANGVEGRWLAEEQLWRFPPLAEGEVVFTLGYSTSQFVPQMGYGPVEVGRLEHAAANRERVLDCRATFPATCKAHVRLKSPRASDWYWVASRVELSQLLTSPAAEPATGPSVVKFLNITNEPHSALAVLRELPTGELSPSIVSGDLAWVRTPDRPLMLEAGRETLWGPELEFCRQELRFVGPDGELWSEPVSWGSGELPSRAVAWPNHVGRMRLELPAGRFWFRADGGRLETSVDWGPGSGVLEIRLDER